MQATVTEQPEIDPLYTKRQIAKAFGCDERTVDRLRERGILRAIKLSNSLVRFARADVIAALEEMREG